MTIANREQQILRVKAASFQTELNEQLRQHHAKHNRWVVANNS